MKTTICGVPSTRSFAPIRSFWIVSRLWRSDIWTTLTHRLRGGLVTYAPMALWAAPALAELGRGPAACYENHDLRSAKHKILRANKKFLDRVAPLALGYLDNTYPPLTRWASHLRADGAMGSPRPSGA